jgi:NADH-quinone oxidoreductase subunit F/NADP-reducing hydrogenase subunit HndC
MGADKVIDGLEEKLSGDVKNDIVQTGCQGFCQNGPLVHIEPSGYFYQKVTGKDTEEVINSLNGKNIPVRRLLFRSSIFQEPYENMNSLPFYQKQMRVVLRNNGNIDPLNILQYIERGGYMALARGLNEMTSDEVLDQVENANLRGRGGAGFPAGKKWRHTKNASTGLKFVIANGDEGDPGAFMDRAIMEGDPHSLIEGMLLCGYAIKARYGFIYVRHEYPLAVENLTVAIEQAERLGLLGENILGTGFSFSLDIREGAGAFVCGESTALVSSIEGERGYPRSRPPRLSELNGGLWGYPTNLNNIETYACVAPIIEKGAKWFKSIGTPKSPGTKVFSLTGKVVNTGLIEVPMGITLREIIYDIGGGILDGKKCKAVQTGGPSGGCIPEKYFDLTVDFDSLLKIGSMMGSGGLVVLDENTCIVDVAKFFISFTRNESCGKCVPCRIGTYQIYEILDRITNGKGRPDDLERLEMLCLKVRDTSLCGLGQSAPNPVLSTLEHFRDEYEAHIEKRLCPAKICNMSEIIYIDSKSCISCGLCLKACAIGAVKETRNSYFIEESQCNYCKACFNICPVNSVKMTSDAA